MPRGLAARLDDVARSATLAMNARVEELRASGRTLFDFGVGEPDFAPPEHALAAASDAVRGSNHYAPVLGTLELRSAVARASERCRGYALDPEQVCVTFGAKQALFNSLLCLLDPGDEVLVPAPYWVSHPAQVQLCGGVPKFIASRKQDGWLVQPEALERSLGPRTKALILCSPANPTGAAYSAEALRALAEVLLKHDCYILCAEGYASFVYDGRDHASLASAAPELRERIVIIDGVSKTYALAGWRVGWAIAPPKFVRALEKVQSQSTSGVSVVAQAVAQAALSGPQAGVDAARERFQRTRRVFAEGLDSIPGLSCEAPAGALYVFPDVSGLYGIRHQGRDLHSARDVALWLLDRAGVVGVAGDDFGAPDHVRFTLSSDEAKLTAAVAAIARAVESAERVG